jgi:hypothetical protein
VRELLGAQRQLVKFRARELELLGDQLGAESLMDERVAVEQLGRVRRSEVSFEPLRGAERDPAHVLDAGADGDVMRAAGDQRRGEVDGLLGRAALPIDGDGRGLDRQSLLQPGVASDVRGLHAVLLYTARDHVIDRRGVDPRTVDDRREHRSEQLVWMHVLGCARLRMPAADRRAGGFDHNDVSTGG